MSERIRVAIKNASLSRWKQMELEFTPFGSEHPPIATVRPSSLSKLKPTIVFDTYWRFAVERQEVFLRRTRPTVALDG